MISSVDNSKIKEVCRLVAKKKERYSRALFVAEGERLVLEAPKERIVSIFCTEDFADDHPESVVQGKTEIVTERVFAKMSDTDTPQGVLAVVRMSDVGRNWFFERYSLNNLHSKFATDRQCVNEIKDNVDHGTKTYAPLMLFIEDIKDPGNLGTIVRSAEAAGVSGIVMSEGTADIYSPKVVRSTMGSIYRMAFTYANDFYGELEEAKKRGIRLYAAYLRSSIPYYEADFTVPCGILIGNEAAGLTDRAAGLADERIIIPMRGAVESLNAAMAAGVIAFEACRQRAG